MSSYSLSCILFHFYIKPQPTNYRTFTNQCCILFHFYIKPQRCATPQTKTTVVSYSISTSNHNIYRHKQLLRLLYLIPFLHQTTTTLPSLILFLGCILFHFYIKPQHHIQKIKAYLSCILFHFYIKPQLYEPHTKFCASCILFHFYIKPQQREYHYEE